MIIFPDEKKLKLFIYITFIFEQSLVYLYIDRKLNNYHKIISLTKRLVRISSSFCKIYTFTLFIQ